MSEAVHFKPLSFAPLAETQDVVLAEFLVSLAIDEKLRARFVKDPQGTLKAIDPPLDQAAIDAVVKRNAGVLLHRILNNQSASSASSARAKR